MTYSELLEVARKDMLTCKVCKVCNGVACRGVMPGPGGKQSGEGFIRNFDKLQEIKLEMDTLYEKADIDMSTELFGKTFDVPFFAAPLAQPEKQYGPKYQNESFGRAMIEGMLACGSLAFTADNSVDDTWAIMMRLIRENHGMAVPTIKPWPVEVMIEKAKEAEANGAIAIATDVDAAGLALVQGAPVTVSPKSLAELTAFIKAVKVPVYVKGIMTVKGAEKCLKAGAAGIVISNHGGRVLEQTPATVEVLPEIVAAVGGKMKIIIDGAIRSGADVFKVIALGADAALIGRPYAVAVYGAGKEGVELYTKKITAEFREAMMMTGATQISEITRDKIRFVT